MIPYLIILLCSVLPIIVQQGSRRLALYLSALFCVTLSLFSGLRYQVGVDYNSYNNFFLTIFEGYDVYFEKGFHLLVEIVGVMWPEPRLVFFVMSILTCTFIFLSILKFSKSYTLSLFLYVSSPFPYMASFNQLRQFFVCAVFFYFLDYITDRKKLLLLLVVFLSFFHKVAILYIPLVLLGERRFNIILYAILLVLLVFVGNYIPSIVALLGISPAYIIDSTSFSVDPRFYIFLFVFLLQYYFLYRDGIDKKNAIDNVLLNMVFVCACIFFLPGFVTVVDKNEILRLLGLFSMSLCFVIPYFVLKVPRYYMLREFFFLIVLVTFSSYFISTLLLNGERYNLVPYSMW